jgi:hypothetical protein
MTANEEGVKEVFLKRDYLHTLSLTTNVIRMLNSPLIEQSPL